MVIFPDHHKVVGIALTLLSRYSSLSYTEEEKAELAKQLLSLSQACSQSLEELTSLGVDIEEDINVEELVRPAKALIAEMHTLNISAKEELSKAKSSLL